MRDSTSSPSSSSSNVQHVRSSSIDGEYDKSKGASSRYGVVWKPPQQQHARSRSIDSTLSSEGGGTSKFVFPQTGARQPDGAESRRNDDYEMIWFSTNNSDDQVPTNSSPPPQYKTASQLELEKQRSKLNKLVFIFFTFWSSIRQCVLVWNNFFRE